MDDLTRFQRSLHDLTDAELGALLVDLRDPRYIEAVLNEQTARTRLANTQVAGYA
jgi:hypothetical protein